MNKELYTYGRITRCIRIIFLTSFAVLTLFGIRPDTKQHNYIPTAVNSPVISHTVEISDTGTAEVSSFPNGKPNRAPFPAIDAQAAAIISADTGEAIFLHNADTPLPMASTTKIMTALVALEQLDPDTVFTVPPEVCHVEGSSIYLVPGEKIKVMDLLFGLMLESGNDAACALAVACCGSIDGFVSRMNQKSEQLGLVNTRFENPHGLFSEHHHTSAYELAKITYHAMKHPVFRTVTGTREYTVTGENGDPLRYFTNHNKLLRTYSGATGGKTGYTIASGRCLVTSAKRDGSEFICVTLNDRNDFRDHAAMLDFAFANYRTDTVIAPDDIVGTFGGKVMRNISGCSQIRQNDGADTKRAATVLLTVN